MISASEPHAFAAAASDERIGSMVDASHDRWRGMTRKVKLQKTKHILSMKRQCFMPLSPRAPTRPHTKKAGRVTRNRKLCLWKGCTHFGEVRIKRWAPFHYNERIQRTEATVMDLYQVTKLSLLQVRKWYGVQWQRKADASENCQSRKTVAKY